MSETTIQALSDKYNEQLKEISNTSKAIKKALEDHYTPEKLNEFKSFSEFLEDVNYLCENGGTGKVIFIKFIEDNYL